jgi:hypothetical protein
VCIRQHQPTKKRARDTGAGSSRDNDPWSASAAAAENDTRQQIERRSKYARKSQQASAVKCDGVERLYLIQAEDDMEDGVVPWVAEFAGWLNKSKLKSNIVNI